ncbi:MAG: hypothetical protein CME59_22010 [Halioglobus sp.]|nr:hypothetical protein [Halioglobus sp.]|tara:strand:+ start:2993 stop:4045 length:1053 start_codon:yes stop_codon:yes gene_type:complete
MITVQDRITVQAVTLDSLERLFREDYLPGAAQRGLRLVATRVSPPVLTANAPLTYTLLWQVADVGAWWAMRAQSGVPEIAAFWAAVDALCLSRERTYSTEDGAASLPGPADTAADRVSTRGHRQTAQLALKPEVADNPAALEAVLLGAAETLPGLQASALGRNFAPEYAAGHLTWDLLYPDAASAAQAGDSATWSAKVLPALTQYCTEVHALELTTIEAGIREPELADGVKRTAFFRLLPGQDTATADRFERDLLEMPAQIEAIRNWRLSRATAAPWNTTDAAPWSYVWEQEFADLDGLLGPYMAHPHHWAYIDRWFDPESGAQAIDADLSHAFSPLENSLLAREANLPD